MPPSDWSARFLASTRGRLVARLRRGPATVEELAAALGLSANGVRVHLATLERDGWVTGESVRRRAGPGKPATQYRLVPEAGAMLSTAYRPLLLALLGTLAARESPARVKALLAEAGRRLAGEMATLEGPLADRAVRALEALGAAAEVEGGGRGGLTVRGLGCPLGAAVSVEPGVCRAVGALLSELLDATVVERCDRGAAAPRCRFEVTRRAS